MKAQFKYALRQGLTLRLAALGITIVMNLVFGILGYLNIWGQSGKIVAVTFSSLALCGILVINIMADTEVFKGLFNAPAGYLTALAPVESWKILLAKTLTILVEDMLSYTVAICGVIFQSFILANKFFTGNIMFHNEWDMAMLGAIVILLGYAYLIMLVAFGSALQGSVFYSNKAGGLFTALAVFAVIWVFNLANFIIAPFGIVEHWKMFYNIILGSFFSAGFAVYVLLSLCKITALFVASSSLMERKINL